MTDINSAPNPLFLNDESLHCSIEMLFFAYQNFTAEPDRLLESYGFGRAHHRVVYFVARNPKISITQLLKILNITKQSLSRVLRQLIDEGFIVQETGEDDRRKRLLSVTQKGEELEKTLSAAQRRLLGDAFSRIDANAVAGFQSVLMGLMAAHNRGRFTV